MNVEQQPCETDHPKLAPVRRRRWIRLVLYAVIFLSGSVVGVGGTLLIVRARALHAVHHPEEMPDLIAHRLQRLLALDDEQTRRVMQILGERQQALQEIRRKYQPEAEAELDKVEEQISDILNDKQREKWQERFQTLRDTWVPALPGS